MYLTRFRRTIKLNHIFNIWLLLVKWFHFITLSPFAFMSNRFIAQYESLHIYLMLHIFKGYIITVSIIVMKIPNPAAFIAHKCQMGKTCSVYNLFNALSGFLIVSVCCVFICDLPNVRTWPFEFELVKRRSAFSEGRGFVFALVLEFATKEEEKEEIIRLDEIQLTSSQDSQWSRSSLT